MAAPAATRTSAQVTSSALLIVSVLALALNLRMGIAAVGPVLPAIVHDLRSGLIYGSLLTTVPVVMMGITAPLSSRIAARIGIEWLLAASLALIAVATLARMWSTTALSLLCTAVAIGAGIAAGNTLLPAVVRTYFPRHTALMTGVSIVGINIGAGTAALGTPRLEGALSASWSGALASWALIALVGGVLWLAIAARIGTRPRVLAGALPWRTGRAWLMTLFFGLQSMVYYAVFAWLAPLYEEQGWSKDRAGLLLFVFSIFQIVGVMLASLHVQRTGARAMACRITAATTLAGLVLLATTPLSAPWLWVALLGLGTGGIFPLSMLLPIAATSTVADARRWTALMLCCGYILGAAGPFVVAALRSASGAFAAPYLALAGACAALFAIARFVTGSRLTSAAPVSEAD